MQSPQTDRIADKRKAGTKSGRGIIPGAAKHSTIRHPETTEKRSTLRHPATTESTGLTKGQTTAQPTKVNSKFGGLEDGRSTLKPLILSSTPIRVTPLESREKWWQSVPTIVPLPASVFRHDTDSGKNNCTVQLRRLKIVDTVAHRFLCQFIIAAQLHSLQHKEQ